jgi:hypothetical protein
LTSLVDYQTNAQRFAISLLQAYPKALFSSDDNDNFQFTYVIQQWTEESYNQTMEAASGIVGAACCMLGNLQLLRPLAKALRKRSKVLTITFLR